VLKQYLEHKHHFSQPLASQSIELAINMSDTPSSEPTKGMTTRSSARDKMAKVMDCICSGSIVKELLSEEVPAWRNKTGKKGKVANKSPTKKASTMKNSTMKKANTE
jgi:hypothetical protein